MSKDELNPYSPPNPEPRDSKPKGNVANKIAGVLLLFFGGMMLLGGIPQLFGALRAVSNPNMADPYLPSNPTAYLIGTLVGLAIGALIARLGFRLLRQKA